MGILGSIGKAVSSLLNLFSKKPRERGFTSAVILAAGSSTRMGEGVSKQWLTLDGLPVIARTLLTFEECDCIDEIVLVVKADEFDHYSALKKEYKLKKLSTVVEGGADRQTSAKNGFLSVSDKAEFVAIHDGARCLITKEEIKSVCQAAYACDAAAAAARVTDTVKLVTATGFVEKTIDRNRVMMAQTPQVFRTAVYHAALAVAARDGVTVTDDCALVKNIEHPVRLVACSPDNFKLTVPEDVTRAEAILARRKEQSV